jgi:HEAT repeat protein
MVDDLASLKEEVKEALEVADFERVKRLALENKKVFSILISLAYDKEDLLCWRAIEAMGKAAGAVAEKDPSTVRNIVQRLIWSVREEAGGIGWSAPEMLGEIVISSPQTCTDIPPIILSFHEEESFLKGVLWAVGRITGAGIDGMEGSFEVLMKALDDKDPSVRGLALCALPGFRVAGVEERVKDMVRDEGSFMIYENHELVEKKVGEIARMVLGVRDETVSYAGPL